MTTPTGNRNWAKAIPPLLVVAVLAGCQGLARNSGSDQTPRGTLSASPTSVSFGKVIVGQNASVDATLRATGAPVSISSVTSTSGEFTVTGISFPATLNPGQNLAFTVTFAPQMSGDASATLTFSSNADNAPTLQAAQGTGTPPPQHSVDLSWKASGSPGVVGYNVYRKAESGYSRINSSLEATTSYTDGGVDAGATYYYVVTAVDGGGFESGYSDRVKVLIPAP